MFLIASLRNRLSCCNTGAGQVFDEANLSNVAHSFIFTIFAVFDKGGTVKDYRLHDVGGAGKGHKPVIDLVVHDLALKVSRLYAHPVLGEGASLVSADLIGVAHGL